MKKLVSNGLGIIASLALSALLPLHSVAAQNNSAPTNYQNPVIPGFHPDPSITRVGEDYYLANSSFEWFPAVPIYHSKDLVNWQLISYAVSEPDYLPELADVDKTRGIYAPTLRYHDGTYYMITTCVQCGSNFYVTATNPQGPWSKPIWVEGDRGIDPDLFWENGKAYYTGTGILEPKKVTWPNPNGIWIQEIDLKTGTLLGSKTQLTYGHAINARWTEGPHIYKIDDKKGKKRYMLLVAEGGTGEDHAVNVFDSQSLKGPYVPHHKNPIITHRNLGNNEQINSTGHADIIQTQNGDWWMVLLAKRKFEDSKGALHNMLARETFLVPVVMENGWPVANPGYARIPHQAQRPDLPWTPFPKKPVRDEFDQPTLDLAFNMLRNPTEKWHQISNGSLVLNTRSANLSDNRVNPSMLVRRIQDIQYKAATEVEFNATKNESAGLVIYRDYNSYYQLSKSQTHITLGYMKKGKYTEVAHVPFTKKSAVFGVKSTPDLQLQFSYGSTAKHMKPIGGLVSAVATSDQMAGGFNGPYVGMYTTSDGELSTNSAEFKWFEYEGFDRAQ
ncbi:glycoside hydrolase family 43 protein [Echinimonas agarilytica]|uniref:Glycoside hydrolase family 43 protein n=1 Tax=Echinimonas agarilytica TaxID=1215918 RepID=A0AA41W3R1_9GAMM|nr:glycoside hydrolase family 43 protein [Echinimonas agarilytica]MCM2678140.1 glycoside hydrolase family 43 protein [Echinimonas agarilytica]